MTVETTKIETGADLAGRAGFALLGVDFIESAEDMSDETTKRVRLRFTNGYQLSVIRGDYSYGGREGLFEIAPIDLDGEMNGDLFDEDDQGDDVCGYCSIEKVNHYVEKIGRLTGDIQPNAKLLPRERSHETIDSPASAR